jgi:hypothetical protein
MKLLIVAVLASSVFAAVPPKSKFATVEGHAIKRGKYFSKGNIHYNIPKPNGDSVSSVRMIGEKSIYVKDGGKIHQIALPDDFKGKDFRSAFKQNSFDFKIHDGKLQYTAKGTENWKDVGSMKELSSMGKTGLFLKKHANKIMLGLGAAAGGSILFNEGFQSGKDESVKETNEWLDKFVNEAPSSGDIMGSEKAPK